MLSAITGPTGGKTDALPNLHALQALTAKLLSHSDPDELLPEILAQAAAFFGTDNGIISLLDANAPDRLEVRCGRGVYSQLAGTSLQASAGAVGQVLRTGDVIVVEDYQRWNGRVQLPLLAETSTVLSAPLQAEGNIIGIIQLAWQHEPRSLTDSELAAFRQFSLLASLVLGKAAAFHRLQNEQALLQAVFNSVPGLIYLFDEQRRLVRWNNTFENLTGHSADFLASTYCLDWFRHNPAELAAIEAGLERAVSNGFGETEASIYTKDGRLRRLYLTAVPLMIDGKAHITGVGIDITDKGLAEKARQDSEAKFRKLVEESPVGIHLYRLETDDRLIFLHSNRASDQLTRFDHRQLLGKTLEEAFPVLADTFIPDLYRRVAKGEQPSHRFETAYDFATGRRHFDVTVFRIAADHIAVNFSDITELKNAIEELQQHRNRLEALVEERTGELTAANEELSAMNEELTAMNEELTAMNEEVISVNETLANMNQRLEDEITNRQKKETLLSRREKQYRATISLLTGFSDNVDNCLEGILRDALQLLDAPGGYIALYDEATRLLPIRHAVGVMENFIDAPRPVDDTLQGQVFRSGQFLYCEDYRIFQHRLTDPRLSALTSVIMVPLWQGSRPKGVLAVYWSDEIHPLADEDQEILRQYGDLASIALDRASAYEQMNHLAFHDPLTGLPNRAKLQQQLTAELALTGCNQAKGAILFIDLDDLKTINDTMGHSVGDEVIIHTSRNILSIMGKKAFVSRIGGDEFVVILPGCDDKAIISDLADIAIQSLSQEYLVGGKSIHMSASIGITLYPGDSRTMDDALKNADNAMYAAKRAGRNCWRFYDPSLQEEAYEKILLTNSLRHALRRGELHLHFQPVIHCRDSRIVGFEALLRWNSPEHGQVPPGRFIPFAEQSGLILPIGSWVIQEACRFVRQCADLGLGHPHVSVNISPRQLAADDFTAMVRATLAVEAISPDQLIIEVTESMLIDSLEESTRKLLELRNLGVHVALDDFGTGYSSLTYLRRLPVTTLKIDKSFIDTLDNENQSSFVGFIIDMAHSLHLTVVAEGVESAGQLAQLSQAGCDCIQGYVFSRPVPAAAALQMLEAKPSRS